jgi:hypothetical protein
MISIPDRDDEVRYPGVVIDDIPLWPITCGKGDRVSVVIQLPFEVGYFVCKGEGGQCVLLFSFVNGGGEALGNVEDDDRVVLVELHHSFGRAGGDGSHRSHGGPYGGQRANGCLDQSIDGDVGHFLGSIGMVIGTGVVFAEPGVNESVVRRLIIDPQEEELLRLEIGLELKGDDFEGDSIRGERF